MKKILIVLLIIILMALSSFLTYSCMVESQIRNNYILCEAAMGFFTGEIAVVDGNHLQEINKIKNFNDLMESVIKNKMHILDIVSKYTDMFVGKAPVIMDKSFLHMRLGFLYKKAGKEDKANIEFETALKLYNSVKDQPIDLEQMIDIYEKLNAG